METTNSFGISIRTEAGISKGRRPNCLFSYNTFGLDNGNHWLDILSRCSRLPHIRHFKQLKRFCAEYYNRRLHTLPGQTIAFQSTAHLGAYVLLGILPRFWSLAVLTDGGSRSGGRYPSLRNITQQSSSGNRHFDYFGSKNPADLTWCLPVRRGCTCGNDRAADRSGQLQLVAQVSVRPIHRYGSMPASLPYEVTLSTTLGLTHSRSGYGHWRQRCMTLTLAAGTYTSAQTTRSLQTPAEPRSVIR